MRATLENWKQIEPCNKVILPGTLKITIKEQLWNSLQLAVNCPRLCTRPVLFHVFQPDYTSSNFIRRTVLLLRLNGDSSLVNRVRLNRVSEFNNNISFVNIFLPWKIIMKIFDKSSEIFTRTYHIKHSLVLLSITLPKFILIYKILME